MSGEDQAPVFSTDGISELMVSLGQDKKPLLHVTATRKDHPDVVEEIHYPHLQPAGQGKFGMVTQVKLLNSKKMHCR